MDRMHVQMFYPVADLTVDPSRWGYRPKTFLLFTRKFSKSHRICWVPIKLQDKWISGHLVRQTATSLKAAGISELSWREMPLLRSISSNVGGEINSPLPLSAALSIYSLFECSLWSAHLFLKLIIGSGKLAYLHLAFRTTEESHKHK